MYASCLGLLLVVAILVTIESYSIKYFNNILSRRQFTLRDSSNNVARINRKIELENAKVVSTISLKSGEKAVLCRCWLSEKFPYCDGCHVKHNKETGDNVAPVIVTSA